MGSTPLHVHIENSRGQPTLFHVTPERWQAAADRHRALAGRLRVTFGWDGETLDDALAKAQAVIGVPGNRHALRRTSAPALRWLHATSAGVEGYLPLDWLPSGVVFTNNRGAHGAKAEEYMRMAYTLLHTRMPEIIAHQQARHWEQLFTPALKGRTALVIGMGDLGEAAARAGKQLGLHVIAVRRRIKKSRHADAVRPHEELDTLLPAADFVVLAVPLTPETHNLLNRERLALMKSTAGVINISRAAVADYGALADCLEQGRLAGAILDVVDPEPLPPEAPLWSVPRLIITPHISCDDSERYIDITLDLWFENLARYFGKRPLLRRVDPARGY